MEVVTVKRDLEDAVAAASEASATGDAAVENGVLKDAVAAFQRCLSVCSRAKIMDQDATTIEPPMWPQLELVAVRARLSLAECYFELEDFAATVVECDQGLRLPIVGTLHDVHFKLFVLKARALSVPGMEIARHGDGDGIDLVQDTIDAAERLGYPAAAVRTDLRLNPLPMRPVAHPIPLDQLIATVVRSTFQQGSLKDHAYAIRRHVEGRLMQPEGVDGRDRQGNSLLIALSAILPIRPPRPDNPNPKSRVVRNSEYGNIVRVLLDLGALPNQRSPASDSHATPLMLASKAWHVEGVQCLLAAGADPNARDNHGFTAVMIACTQDDVAGDQTAGAEVIRMLLDAGAQPGMMNTLGGYPLLECAMSGFAKGVPLLSAVEDPDRIGLAWYTARGLAVYVAHETLLAGRKSTASSDSIQTADALCARVRHVYGDASPGTALLKAIYASMLIDQLRRAAASAVVANPATPFTPQGKLEEFTQASRVIQTLASYAGVNLGGNTVTRPDDAPSPRSMDDWLAACAACGQKPGVHTCKACRVARYCSAECQKKSWKAEHKHQCAWLAFTEASTQPWNHGQDEAGRANTDTNVLLTLHRFVASIVPNAWVQLYTREALNDVPKEDLAVLMTGHAKAADDGFAVEDTLGSGLTDFPNHLVCDRVFPSPLGGQSNLALLAVKPLQHYFSFSVPSNEALEALCELGPLIELGCGTGYWAMLLRRRGVDVLALDIRPPTTVSSSNMFHPTTWTDVSQGGSDFLKNSERTLFLSWPTHTPTEAWDVEALKLYRGTTLAYVGAWNCGDLADPEYKGTCSSVEFQQQLLENWDLKSEVALPRWPAARDTLTIWTRTLPS